MTLHLFHRWGKWEDCMQVRRQIPLGAAYPPGVRGKEFKTETRVQMRRCEVCGKQKVRRVR